MVRSVFVGLALLMVGVLATGSVAAHATHYSPDGKLKFVYGHLNEPTYTFDKTGLDLGIYDNATGKGISGLGTDARQGDSSPAPKLWVHYRYGAEGGELKNISGDFRAQHGQVGKYTHPITFTRPGLYYILITGTINGTVLDNVVIAPAHAIESQEGIMWPDQFPADNEQVERIEALEQKVAALESGHAASVQGQSASLELIPILGAIAVIALLVRRR